MAISTKTKRAQQDLTAYELVRVGSDEYCPLSKLFDAIKNCWSLNSKTGKKKTKLPWRHLGKLLGLATSIIDGIKDADFNSTSQAHSPAVEEIIRTWLFWKRHAGRGQEANLKTLIQCFETAGCYAAADNILRAFQEEAKLLYKRQNKRTREKVSNPINIPESEPNWLTIGKFKDTEFNPIHNHPDDKVFNRQVDDVPIALKIFEFQTKTQMKKIMDNIKPLLNTDIDHENILKYHGVEKDIANNCIYLRLDFYNGTLQQAVYNRLEGIYLDDSVSLQILRQITEGVAHLHQNKIAHKNLKLGNIFIFKKSDSEICVKISDAGIDNPKSDCESFNGIPQWKAPEFESDQKVTGACDIFSLGCIFHFVLTRGKYPFGDSNQKGFLKEVEYPRIPEVVLSNLWLIREMTMEDPKKRPKVKDILSHHIFWTSEKTLNFFIQIASLIDKVRSKHDEEEETPNEISGLKVKAIVSEMETHYKRVVTKRFGYHQHLQSYRDWLKFMGMDEDEYRETVQRHRRVHKSYKNKISEFIELIRNLGTDFEKFPQHVKNVVGKPPDEFLGYWRHQFPLLVPMLWILFQKLRSDDEYEMKEFYGNRHKFGFQSESLYCYANNEMFLSVKEGTLLQKNVERLSTLSV